MQTWAFDGPRSTYGLLVASDWPMKGQLEISQLTYFVILSHARTKLLLMLHCFFSPSSSLFMYIMTQYVYYYFGKFDWINYKVIVRQPQFFIA